MSEGTTRLARFRSRRWLVRLGIAAGLLILAGVLLVPRLLYSFSHESTDDAYVDGTIIPLSAQVAGQADSVLVQSHQEVRAGQPLVAIAPADYRSAVTAAEAALARARAQVREAEARIDEASRQVSADRARLESARVAADLAAKDAGRSGDLLAQGAVSQSDYDAADTRARQARAARDAAEATVAQSEAAWKSLKTSLEVARTGVQEAETALESARRNLGRTVVSAPVAGRIARLNVDVGQYVAVGQPLMALVEEQDVWVTANFKETQIARIRVGMPVELDVDAYPGVTVRGRVLSFEPGTGSVFSLLPPENATGNFIKTTQRVPVRIRITSDPDPQHPLWPGLSVTAHVDVAAGADAPTHGA